MAGYVYRGNEPFVPPTPKQIADRPAPPIRTHCLHGHERTPENIDAANRRCRICREEGQHALVTCSICGHEMQTASFYNHRNRKTSQCKGAVIVKDV